MVGFNSPCSRFNFKIMPKKFRTYEEMPDIIRETLWTSHEHNNKGDIVYPEDAVLKCLFIALTRQHNKLKASAKFLKAEKR